MNGSSLMLSRLRIFATSGFSSFTLDCAASTSSGRMAAPPPNASSPCRNFLRSSSMCSPCPGAPDAVPLGDESDQDSERQAEHQSVYHSGHQKLPFGRMNSGVIMTRLHLPLCRCWWIVTDYGQDC